jgi:transcriptional regulator with XRE-family HTH domain
MRPMVDTVETPLRRLRLERGWTQVQLAERAKVPQQHLSALERGRVPTPSWPTVRRLSRALRVKPETLFPVQ